MSVGVHLLGRNLERDERSRAFKHSVEKIVRKRNVVHTLSMPHLDQGNIGSCEGNTAMEFLGTAKALRNRRAYWATKIGSRGKTSYPTEREAVEAYGLATTLDNDQIPGRYPPSDTGTSGLGIAKAMQQLGAIRNYNWTFTFEAFLATLQTRPIMLGTNWYQSMFEVTDAGFVHVQGSNAVGGHAYLAYAVDFTHERVGCTNHWRNEDGTLWGVKIGEHNGSFWICFNDLERILIKEQGDSLVPVLM